MCRVGGEPPLTYSIVTLRSGTTGMYRRLQVSAWSIENALASMQVAFPEIAASVELRNRRAREQASVSVHLVLVDYDCEGDTRPAHPARPNVSSSSSLACCYAAIQSKGLRALLRARSHHIPVRVPISGYACTHLRLTAPSVWCACADDHHSKPRQRVRRSRAGLALGRAQSK